MSERGLALKRLFYELPAPTQSFSSPINVAGLASGTMDTIIGSPHVQSSFAISHFLASSVWPPSARVVGFV